MGKELGLEKPAPKQIPHWRQVIDQGGVTPEIIEYPYPGSGTEHDPYIINWIPNDPRNPLLYSPVKKWAITLVVSIATLAVALISSAYTGGANQIAQEFKASSELVTLGVSLFVLGFAIGPLVWAPMGELFGRQIIFAVSYCALTAFNGAAVGSQNMRTLLVLRFFAGAFGSSPLTNAGGVIADMFSASERGMAMGLFAMAPFLGPIIGPIAGGFLGMAAGWRWVQGLLAIFSGVVCILGMCLVPETYPLALLRKRAQRLSQLSGKTYVSRMDADNPQVTAKEAFLTAISRPWVLLFREPIVLLLSIYMAIIYGTLYMMFAAFPIIFQQTRGWNQGVGGLAFLGILVGMVFGSAYHVFDNKRYIRVSQKYNGFAPPEARLPVSIVGGIAIPVSLFWFAWTSGPEVHWIVPIIASAPFGFGMVLIFLGLMSYLVDAYTIYAASVLAANSVLRCLFGAAFPMFTRYMYQDLGIHWASSIPAFLALACVPFPFLFYKYGAIIRKKCKFANESDEFMRKIAQASMQPEHAHPHMQEEKAAGAEASGSEGLDEETDEDATTYIPGRASLESQRALGLIGSRLSRVPTERLEALEYEGNPYNIDRVNTGQSLASSKRRKSRERI
ncbi:MFS siderochrome iron transporter 1 [Myotisia sp. PD_48]|nr:MFS siderochrome iron transporter 1 [Myotisia sp. PD_48]